MSRILCSLSDINCPNQLLAALPDELLYFKLSEVTGEQNRSSNGVLLTFWGFFGLDKKPVRIQNNRGERRRDTNIIYMEWRRRLGGGRGGRREMKLCPVGQKSK